jgi:putative phosphoesterase
MLIAIISDIHDNLANLTKTLGWCQQQGITQIICCGDTTTLATIKNLAQFPGEIFLVSGNAELYENNELTVFKNIKYYGETGLLELAGLKIGLTHEPRKIRHLIQLSQAPLDFIFYGHTHKPWLEQREGISLVNPGNLAGIFYQASFATLDPETKKLDLKILARL